MGEFVLLLLVVLVAVAALLGGGEAGFECGDGVEFGDGVAE